MDWFFPLKLLSSVATLVKLLIFVISLSYSEVIEDDVDQEDSVIGEGFLLEESRYGCTRGDCCEDEGHY